MGQYYKAVLVNGKNLYFSGSSCREILANFIKNSLFNKKGPLKVKILTPIDLDFPKVLGSIKAIQQEIFKETTIEWSVDSIKDAVVLKFCKSNKSWYNQIFYILGCIKYYKKSKSQNYLESCNPDWKLFIEEALIRAMDENFNLNGKKGFAVTMYKKRKKYAQTKGVSIKSA